MVLTAITGQWKTHKDLCLGWYVSVSPRYGRLTLAVRLPILCNRIRWSAASLPFRIQLPKVYTKVSRHGCETRIGICRCALPTLNAFIPITPQCLLDLTFGSPTLPVVLPVDVNGMVCFL
jgi:hypothetical protein